MALVQNGYKPENHLGTIENIKAKDSRRTVAEPALMGWWLKFGALNALAAQVQGPGVEPHHSSVAKLWQWLTQKNQKDLQLEYTAMHWGLGEGKKKREEHWQQMLSQGESQQNNKERFANTCSAQFKELFSFY